MEGAQFTNETLSAEFPPEFLATYGPSFYQLVEVLGGMASRGERMNIIHSAHLLRLMIGAASSVANEVHLRRDADDWSQRWVM